LTRTALELRGVFCLPLLLEPPISKSIMSSMSFGKLVEDVESLRQVISTYAAESAAKMRREWLACSSVVVFLETNRFRDEP
jgi:DNA polymerase V